MADRLKGYLLKLKGELTERYPYGCSLIGLRGQIFTTFDDIQNTNAAFKVDGPACTLKVDKSQNTVSLQVPFIKIKEIPLPNQPKLTLARAVGACILNLADTNGFSMIIAPGVDQRIDLIDSNPDAPVVAVGFKPTSEPSLLELLPKDWLQQLDAAAKAATNAQSKTNH